MKELINIEKNPKKGLMAFEWIVLAYAAITTLFILYAYRQLPYPQELLMGRLRIVGVIALQWLVYRLAPCRLTLLARVAAQMVLLSWWYPDTYELNRILPNCDHLFAQMDQTLFGCQPALLFSHLMPWHWFSELMDLGYASYFPMILFIEIYYFFVRYDQFEKASTVLITSFFIYYIIFVFLPVTGPQYYYLAIDANDFVAGVFPPVGDFFNLHADRIVSPGWEDGLFYHLVEDAHQAGERPTAAFPSSHVGITVVILLLAWHAHSRRQWLFFMLLPFAVLMLFATVYIQAHYFVDVVAGLLSGVLFYFVLMYLYKTTTHEETIY